MVSHVWIAGDQLAIGRLGSSLGMPDAVGHLIGVLDIWHDIAHDPSCVERASEKRVKPVQLFCEARMISNPTDDAETDKG